MKFVEKSLEQFVEQLASSAPVPGGGGASALVGAVGIALGMMVANLTTGKPAYASVEKDIQKLLEKTGEIKAELLRLVDADAVAFMPLAKAYAIPKDDPSRGQVMEDALKKASAVPMEIMRNCAKAIELCDELAKTGARGALSDAGVAVVCCKAALQGASLNVFINTKYMDNKAYARGLVAEANSLLFKYCNMADEIFVGVAARLS